MRNIKLWMSVLSLLGLACDQAPTITYWKDVAPIVNSKCVACHQEGGVAPMALDSYEAVKTNAKRIAAVTSSGQMPPFLLTHDGTCGPIEDGETLNATEIARLTEWSDSAMTEGTKVATPTPAIRSLGDALSYQTPMMAPVAQGGMLAEHDEYRCYAFDAQLNNDAFITGYEVLPGNAAMVHHLLAFVVDPTHVTQQGKGKTNGELMQALDELEPDRAGWPCFGLAGEGVETVSAPVTWAPGQGPVHYPNGMGAPLRKTDKVIVQIHYNLADPRVKGQTDSSTLRLRTAETVERKVAFVLHDPLLNTLFSGQPTLIPPLAASTQLKWKVSAAELGLGGLPFVDLIGVMPHMHALGKRLRLDISNDGVAACMAKVDRWDIGWQKFYFYKEPVRLTGGSQLELMCDFDTSAVSQATAPGWGSRNEMCLTVLMLALPSGL